MDDTIVKLMEEIKSSVEDNYTKLDNIENYLYNILEVLKVIKSRMP